MTKPKTKMLGNLPRLVGLLSYSSRYLMLSLCLSLFGVLAVYSSSAAFMRYEFMQDSIILIRQSSYLGVGSLLMLITSKIPSDKWNKYSYWFLLLTFLLMALVLIPGIGDLKYGARRWFRFLGIGFQPSELLKFALILWMASFISRKKKLLKNFSSGLLPAIIILGISGVFLILQPDFGTIVLISGVMLLMGFYGGMAIKHILVGVSLLAVVSVVAILNNVNRMQRLISYLDPWADPTDSGFQLVNSLIALGNGGILGRGIGNSLQKQYYLPFAHTDFIFATIGEELGLVGVVAVVAGYIALTFLGYRIAYFCRDAFAKNLVFGLTTLLSMQSLFHFGVVTGLLPTKGIGLPFISYGGSSLVVFLAMTGIVYRCGQENKM
ncbi:MAG: putative lipid II flippase FtsW [SAR324 cluster bacterium]|nr:putative lipid II flippase FtsW [SAR324 cluster bacterium]